MSNTRNRVISITFLFAFVFAAVAPGFAQNKCVSLGPPVVQTGSIATGDTAQSGRLNRDGRGSTCEFLRTPPAPFTGALLSDSYTYTNTSAGPICVFVELDATGCGVATNQISIAAYLTSYNPAAVTANLIGDPGLSSGQNFATAMSFTVPAGATYVIVVHNINAGTFCPSYTFRKWETNNCKDPGFDHNTDGQADLAIFRPQAANSPWASFSIATGGGISANLGSTGDIPVPGDYDGNQTYEPAVFRGSNGTWYTSTDPGTNYGARLWGVAGDIPVQGDYDRDSITDLAIYRPSNNRFYILRSSGMVYQEVPLGVAGDKPVVADYDGDGKTDPAVFRPSNGRWIWLTSAGNLLSYNQLIHGVSTDLPVPADYDGDGKADVAVYRPSEGGWYILRSSLSALGVGQNLFVQFGTAGDMPQPADYDGDRRADQAVFRPSTGTWWIQRSTAGLFVKEFGVSSDIPATSPNTIQ